MKAFRNLPEIFNRSHTPLPSFTKPVPSSPSKPSKRVPSPIDVNAANQNQSPSMLRLVEALDRISIPSSILDPPTSPKGPPSVTSEDSQFRIHIQIPSTTSSTSSLGPITPLDKKPDSWSLEPSATIPKISNISLGHYDGPVHKSIDRKRPVMDQARSGTVKSSPRHI